MDTKYQYRREIHEEDIFNSHTLNIFTDASILQKPDNSYDGCAGSIGVLCNDKKDIFIDSRFVVKENTTNNELEISAIQLGIYYAIERKNIDPKIDTINLFSDSKISIFGLREWIYSWIEHARNGILISSSGNPVKNQDIFIDCVDAIVRNNLNITFYHINGHVKFNSGEELYKALQRYRKANDMMDSFIDLKLFKKICECNDIVDINSRDILQGIFQQDKLFEMANSIFKNYNSCNLINTICSYSQRAFTPFYQSIDLEVYKKLIGGN